MNSGVGSSNGLNIAFSAVVRSFVNVAFAGLISSALPLCSPCFFPQSSLFLAFSDNAPNAHPSMAEKSSASVLHVALQFQLRPVLVLQYGNLFLYKRNLTSITVCIKDRRRLSTIVYTIWAKFHALSISFAIYMSEARMLYPNCPPFA